METNVHVYETLKIILKSYTKQDLYEYKSMHRVKFAEFVYCVAILTDKTIYANYASGQCV